jgi:hypothetical protein
MFHPNLGRWMTLDPIAYDAGDTNLYRHVSNSPTNFTDSIGLQPQRLGIATTPGLRDRPDPLFPTMIWTFQGPPVPPQGVAVYTHIKIEWSTYRCPCWGTENHEGGYEVWLKGLRDKNSLKFNLTFRHGSHAGSFNKNPAWPIFSGKTEKEREEQLTEYIQSAFSDEGTGGNIRILVEYRGYKNPGNHVFSPPLTNEPGGPFETPGSTTDSKGSEVLRAPNRFRTDLRKEAPWSMKEPGFWSQSPDWSYSTSLDFRWGCDLGENASYTISQTGKDPTSGSTQIKTH